ncbi:MAG: heavy metal-binding domain-containing protein, partial [Pseudomonadota bacterium]
MNDHSKHEGHGGGHTHASHAPQNLTDPVCHMNVDPKSAKGGSHEHAGMTYYFCSAGCAGKFKAAPEHYLQRSDATPVPPPVIHGASYTCPMHPEIVRDRSGDCPICGMALVPIAGTGEADDSELRDLTRRFWTGTALSIPLVVLAMAPMIGFHEPFGLAPRARGWVELVLGTPVVLWVGWPILRKFWLSLTHRALNMYTLIGLGISLAFVFSLAAVFVPSVFPAEFRMHDGAVGTYFEAAAVIVTLVLLGDVLRGLAHGVDAV